MLGKLAGWDDTIVALATPPGIGAIGVLRLSGKQSISITNALFPSRDLAAQPSHTLHVGFLQHQGRLLDEVVLALYKAPRSYTGEEVVEISCHGSPYIQDLILQALLQGGARLAKPGEFTQRAFLNGKLDLTQAEAVADIIASNTEASRKTALSSLRGGFSHDLRALREQLLRFSSLIELELDFSQEDVEFADRAQFFELISDAESRTLTLLESFRLGNVIKNGVQVAIVGKPNAGKSTLLNTLLNENRAIVSEIAGTTRDTIEEILNIEGILFRLVDTAGIRQHTADIIEGMGVERSLEKIRQADLVIYLFEASDELEEIVSKIAELQRQGTRFLAVINKIDLAGEVVMREKFSQFKDAILISAKVKRHIESLKSALVNKVLSGYHSGEGTIVTNVRHYQALQNVLSSLSEVKKGLLEKIPGDLLAPDIRRCLHFIGEITGEITSEDQLDYIFSKFCIGK